MLATDGTHKCVWQGYKVLLVGTIDRTKAFHPFGVGITTGETEFDYKFIFESLKKTVYNQFDRTLSPTILLADGADAIHNGFALVFDLERRIMCWAHVSRNFIKNNKHLPKKELNQVYNDIEQLQLCFTEKMFTNASQLFVNKWIDNHEVKDTIETFKKYYIDSAINGWFDGRASGYPVTNNSLESNNSRLKDLCERKTLKLDEFLVALDNKVLKFWSFARSDLRPDSKAFNTEPEISISDYRRALEWTDLNLKIETLNFSNKKYYFVQSTSKFSSTQNPVASTQPSSSQVTTQPKTRGRKKKTAPSTESMPTQQTVQPEVPPENNKLTKAKCKAYLAMINECNWVCFDDFRASFQDLRVIALDRENWKLSTCSCPSWHKHYMCKHIIGVAYNEDLFDDFPDAAYDIPLGQRRGAGRPKQISKALSFE
jgi:hypothetical protein